MQLDLLGEAVAANPVLTGILVVMIALILGAYIFIQRILTSAKEGYQAGRSDR